MATKKPAPVNKNKQLRLDDDIFVRVSMLVERSGLSESDVLRLALKAGLPRLESGEQNPFSASFGKMESKNVKL